MDRKAIPFKLNAIVLAHVTIVSLQLERPLPVHVSFQDFLRMSYVPTLSFFLSPPLKSISSVLVEK